MRERAIAIAAIVLGLAVVGSAVGIWNLIDTQEPVDPIQLSP